MITGTSILHGAGFHRVYKITLLLWAAVVLHFFYLAEAHAQQAMRGDIEYPYLGIQLSIPEGWKGQEDGDFLVLASDAEPGLVGLTVNEAKNINELKGVADQGWIDEGVRMMRNGEFERIGAEGMGAEFHGMFQGANAKAFIAGIINPFGSSVTIIALTSEAAYGPSQVELVRNIADSLKFALPREAEHNASWREGLPGRALTAMDSSYSSGPDYYDASGQSYGSYSSYSSRHVIYLCSGGDFYSSNTSTASFDAVGGFGRVNSGGSDEGNWQVTTSGSGESVLQLNYADGSVGEFVLSYEDGKTYLNGGRYYRTESDACS